MKTLAINAHPFQSLQTQLKDKSTLNLVLQYLPVTKQWSIDVSHKNFKSNGNRICNSLNLLEQSSLLIPFGINISVSDGGEPFLLGDFQSGRVQLSILDSDEVELVSSYYATYGDNTANG